MLKMSEQRMQNAYLQMGHHLLEWMEDAKNYMEDFIDNLPAYVGVVDVDGYLCRANHRMAALVKSPLEECHCVSLRNCLPSDSWESLVEHAKNGQREGFEVTLVDGGQTLLCHVWPYAGGRVRGQWFWVFAQDVIGRDSENTKHV